MKGATPVRARRPDAVGIRAASYDSASLAGRPIRATRSMTLLNHRPLTTPVPLHARWGLSRLSSHQSRLIRKRWSRTRGRTYHDVPSLSTVPVLSDFQNVVLMALPGNSPSRWWSALHATSFLGVSHSLITEQGGTWQANPLPPSWYPFKPSITESRNNRTNIVMT